MDDGYETTKEQVAEANSAAILFDGFEGALIGFVRRFGVGPVALYDYDKCIEILMKRDKMPLEDADEWFESNVIGGWHGENTPCFATIIRAVST
jgi:hypothetical protein